ncbi:hypothetical protein ACFQFH_07760 [Halobaculum halobium]|uniref:Helix-turn-helix domain-containing protein n=1 Tax=Halobaculum halobium TaxID=3032281 RepID=A0ABD5TEB0_9EURY|nr:hypothetical protein [Halobaculum sp. SYNS20]
MTGRSTNRAVDAFSFLGDDLRLSILRALAERESRAGPRTDPMAYSDLRRTVGEEDSGKFSYHLGKLTGRFVEKTPNGYRLREPGRETVRLLERGIVDGDAELDAEPVDARCPRCGGDVHVIYTDHHLFTCCAACEGLFGADECPSGTLSGIVLPPTIVERLDPTPLVHRAHRVFERRLRPMIEGICLECGGGVDGRLTRCPDHATDGICPDCHTAYPALAEVVCETCGRGRITHPLFGNPAADGVDAGGGGDAVGTRPETVGTASDAAEHTDGRTADGEGAWRRFGTFLSWRARHRDDGSVAFEPPNGDKQVVVTPDLRVVA